MDLTEPVVAATAALIVLFAPLIPATIIFLVFPDSKVALTGPFAQVSVRASGAFAGYLVLAGLASQLLIVYYNSVQNNGQRQLQQKFDMQQQQFAAEQHQRRPVWIINGKIKLLEENGDPITDSRLLALMDQVEWGTNPPEFFQNSNTIQLKIPEEETGIPRIVFKIKGFGESVLTLKPDAKQSILGETDVLNQDVKKNVIEITDPIKVYYTKGPYQIADHRSGDQIESKSVTVNGTVTEQKFHSKVVTQHKRAISKIETR